MQVRRLFAGSNGANGFHSFFQYIIGEDARRVYLLKGGPGTGKSRLMKDVASALQAEGLALELFFCSSDSHSLDAFACPELGVAVMDATSPHAQEPELPGCRDELIALGDFWDGEKLAQDRDEIAAVGRVKARHFASAFRYFAAALALEENLAARAAGGRREISGELTAILEQIQSAERNGCPVGRARHLFASALTPEGYVSEIASLSAGMHTYVLTGPPGSGQSEYLELMLRHGELAGLNVEVFHYPLRPERLLHLLFPELNLAVLTATELEPLHSVQGERICCGLERESTPDARDRQLFRELVDLGVGELRQAQHAHAAVEELYAVAMDFGAVEQLRERLKAEILAYKNRS